MRCARLPARKKITLGEMRASGVRGLLIYCANYQCSYWIRISADPWPDHVPGCPTSRTAAQAPENEIGHQGGCDGPVTAELDLAQGWAAEGLRR